MEASMIVGRKHSPPGAKSGFYAEREECEGKIMAAIYEFEDATGRTVDGVCISHVEVTSLLDSEPRYAREAHIAWLPTAAEEARSEEINRAWRAYFDGTGPRPDPMGR
jgi:hypothetical protein